MLTRKKYIIGQRWLLSLMFVIGFGAIDANANNESILFTEKVNLALRRTADRLLRGNGDSTSVIPPVEQLDANTFVIRLDSLFDYDKLPALLQQSLDLHKINRTYNVSILNCENGKLQLGYSFFDLRKDGGVACAGRKRTAGCYNLKLTFEPEQKTALFGAGWWMFPVGTAFALLGFMVWRNQRKRPPENVTIVSNEESPDNNLHFGNSRLDASNMFLKSGDYSHKLTYREAKLLKLFISHANQVLERDFILKSVWEDEGIIVGRSVDVFVSRLRKMLAGDQQIKITAVHGIGYRMEVL
jgi:hypothetical protein